MPKTLTNYINSEHIYRIMEDAVAGVEDGKWAERTEVIDNIEVTVLVYEARGTLHIEVQMKDLGGDDA